MDLVAFKELTDPAEVSAELQAMWHDAHGDWDRAHELAQQAGSREGDWVHAYLHRKEGDTGNAGYWYARSGHEPVRAGVPFETEWEAIVEALLMRDAE